MRRRIFAHIRRTMVRGLLLVLPLLITLWLLSILFEVVDKNVTPLVMGVLQWTGVPWIELWIPRRVLLPLIGLIVTGVFVYLLGQLAGNLAGRRIVAAVESSILRIPLVKGIYGSARQLLNAFTLTGKKAFSKVVIVEYPRKGLWTVGFVTSEAEHQIRAAEAVGASSTVAVFLPTTPNPTSGWMLLVPRQELMVLDMTIEEGIKLIVSGGMVSPGNLGSLVKEWSPNPTPPDPLA